MLKETIPFKNNLPFLIDACNIQEENFHWHEELEMVLVLRGTTTYTIHHLDYPLAEGDLLIVDGEDLHRIKDSSKDVLLLRTYVDLLYFTDLYPDIYFMIFACEECARDSAAKQERLKNKVFILKRQLCKMADQWFNEPDNRQQHMDNIGEFIFLLVNHFQSFFIENKKFKTREEETNKVDLERIYHIFEYIYVNHSKKITLKDLGELEHLSPYYISHLIKETTGLAFQDFLGYLRVEVAQKLLLEPEFSLTYISETCGFSSLNYFNKCFKYWHGIMPSEFRKNYRPCRKISYGEIDLIEVSKLIKPYLGNQVCRREEKPLHIFISLDAQKKAKNDFRREYPLRLLISSGRELAALAHLETRMKALGDFQVFIQLQALYELLDTFGAEMASLCLKQLNASHLNLRILGGAENKGADQRLQDIVSASGLLWGTADTSENASNLLTPAKTLASAFDNLKENTKGFIALVGSGGALFTAENFCTPYFHLFSLLAKLDGSLICEGSHHFIVQGKTRYYILIFHSEPGAGLRAHTIYSEETASGSIIKHTFHRKHSCFSAMELLHDMDFNDNANREIIEKIAAGDIDIFRTDEHDNAGFDFDLNIPAQTLTLLEIPINLFT